jgi:hypothetical protein
MAYRSPCPSPARATPHGSHDDADRLAWLHNGGGGSDLGWDFWVYPPPPDGPVTLVASWLEHGCDTPL